MPDSHSDHTQPAPLAPGGQFDPLTPVQRAAEIRRFENSLRRLEDSPPQSLEPVISRIMDRMRTDVVAMDSQPQQPPAASGILGDLSAIRNVPRPPPRLDLVRQENLKEVRRLRALVPAVIPNATKRTSAENLHFLLGRLEREIDHLPLDKLGRWIGFVHGVLALSGHMDVDETRDITRDGFRAAYAATGQYVPPTMDMETPD